MIIDRNTDQRYIGEGAYVAYNADKATEWLVGLDPNDERGESSVADTHDVDRDWPGRNGGADDKLHAVISLVDDAIEQKVIGIPDNLIAEVGYERTCDSGGVLDGARLLVTMKTGVKLAGPPVWASDLINDEFGAKGALNALWNTAWEIHYLVKALVEWPTAAVEQGQ